MPADVHHKQDRPVSNTQQINLDIPIESIKMSLRLRNVLKKANVTTLRKLLALSPEEVIGMRNLGKKTLQDVNRIRLQYGFEPLFAGALEGVTVLRPHSPKARYSLVELEEMEFDKLRLLKISDIAFSTRFIHGARKLGVQVLDDFLTKNITPEKFISQWGMGIKTLKEFRYIYDLLYNKGTQFAFPEKFKSIEIKFFIIPRIVDEFLEKNHISTFGELIKKDENDLIGLTPFIKQSLTELLTAIKKNTYFENYIPRPAIYFPVWVDYFIKNMEEGKAEIFKMRFGYYGRPKTLEEIGSKNNVTRERIRQLVNQYINDFGKIFNLFLKDVEPAYYEVIFKDLAPLSEENITRTEDEDLSKSAQHPPRMYLYFLHELFPTLPIKVNGKLLSDALTPEELKSEESIVMFLKRRLPLQIPHPHLKQFVNDNFGIAFHSFLRISLLSRQLDLSLENSQARLKLRRYIFPNALLSIINLEKSPLTISQLKEKLNYYYPGINFSTVGMSIRLRLSNVKEVFRIDYDLWGNINHLRALCPNLDEINDVCFKELQKRKLPTAVYDLVPLVSFSGLKITPRSYNLLLNAIMSSDKRFVKLGRLIFGLKEWGEIKLENVANLAYKEFHIHRTPMSILEICDLIKKHRSITQISLDSILSDDERFCAYPRAWYGLVEYHEQNLRFLIDHQPYMNKLLYSQYPDVTVEKLLKILKAEKYVSPGDIEKSLKRNKQVVFYRENGIEKIIFLGWKPKKFIELVLKQYRQGLTVSQIRKKIEEICQFRREFREYEIKDALWKFSYFQKKGDKYVFVEKLK